MNKVITNEVGEPLNIKKDVTFDYAIYKGDKISFADYSADAVGASLTGSDFTFVNDLITYELPESGGIGTRIIYILGTAFVLVASILLIFKKRIRNNS